MPKYTLNIDDGFDETLSALAKKKGVSKAEIIRRAVASYGYLSDETLPQQQRKVSITDKNDSVIKDIVLP